jgi:hypothetical protein
MSSFLAASALEPSSWREKLPPLYIHSATGHPLSLRHSAQQRPMWGPSLQQQGIVAHAGMQHESGFDHMGRFYGLYKGRMGQQQLLLGGAAAAAGAKRGMRQGSGGSGEFSGGTFGVGSGELSYSQIESESGDNGAGMMEDVSSSAAGSSGGRGDDEDWQQQQQQQRRVDVEVEESNGGLGALPGKRFKLQPQMGAGAFEGGSGGTGRAESSELLVVPSVSAGGAAAAAAAGRDGGMPMRVGGLGYLQRPQRFECDAAAAEDADADMMEDDDDDDEPHAYEYYAGRQRHGRFGGGRVSRPAASISTACSEFKGMGGAEAAAAGAPDDGAVESIGEDDVMQQIEQQHNAQQGGERDALLLIAEAARLQELQLEATSRPRV